MAELNEGSVSIEAVYELNKVTENPLFEGFAFSNSAPSLLGRVRLSEDFVPQDTIHTRNWTVPKLSRLWNKSTSVSGRVRPFNDYPCIDMTIPAFSARAVECLRQFLAANGELLSVKNAVGSYYAYNITTVADVVDTSKSSIDFFDPEAKACALEVDHFVLKKNRLKGLSIFRLPELPNSVFVTDKVKECVEVNGLNGFHFVKIWPYPLGTNWELEEVKRRRAKKPKKSTTASASNQANSVVLVLEFQGKKPTSAESKLIKGYLDDLDAQLTGQLSMSAPYFGNLEGTENIDGACRIFLSCASADKLATKLLGWLRNLQWPGSVRAVKRNGNFADPDAREVDFEF
jgi:hypothetical protein